VSNAALKWRNGSLPGVYETDTVCGRYMLVTGRDQVAVFFCANGVTTTSVGRADNCDAAAVLAREHAAQYLHELRLAQQALLFP
jgi:hypothetical protein